MTREGKGSLEVHGVSEGFLREMIQNSVLRGEIGFNQMKLWEKGKGWFSRAQCVGKQSNERKQRNLGNATSSVWHRVIRVESGIGMPGSVT